MLRYFVLGIFVIAAGGLTYSATKAGAADLFIKRQEDTSVSTENTHQSQKSLKGSKELFNRREGYSASPYYAAPTLQRSSRKIQTFKEPAIWAMMDETTKSTKRSETERVIREQKQKEAEIDKMNTEADQKAASNSSKQNQQQDTKTKKNTKMGNKKDIDLGQEKKSVIKRKKSDDDDGKPRKLFNSP